MFKLTMELAAFLTIAILLITQVMLPMFIPDMEMFWMFKKKKKVPDIPKKNVDESLQEIANELEQNSNQYRESIKRVDDTIETLTEVKNKTNNNLNN